MPHERCSSWCFVFLSCCCTAHLTPFLTPCSPPPVLQVTGTMGSMKSGLHQHLARLDEIFATRGDYVQTLQFMQQMADNVIKQLLGLPDWEEAKVDLASIADQTASVEYYR